MVIAKGAWTELQGLESLSLDDVQELSACDGRLYAVYGGYGELSGLWRYERYRVAALYERHVI